MKRFLVLCSLAVAVFMVNGVLASSMSIATVDVRSILKSSPQVKTITAQLQKQFSARKNDLQKLQATVEADIANYTKNKSILSAKKVQALQAKIAAEGQKLRTKQAAFQQAIYAAQNKKMGVFLSKLKIIIKKIAKKKHIILVLPKDSVLYSRPNLDITSDVEAALK